MANNIVTSFFSSSSLKINKKSTGEDVAGTLKVMRVSVKLTASALRHMKENGSTVVDSRIIEPAMVAIEVFCQNLDSYRIVDAILMDRTSLYKITSKGLVFDNMMCETERVTQSPDALSAMPVSIVFKQALSKNTNPVIFSQSADASAVSRGMNLLSSAANSVGELYNSIASKFNG